MSRVWRMIPRNDRRRVTLVLADEVRLRVRPDGLLEVLVPSSMTDDDIHEVGEAIGRSADPGPLSRVEILGYLSPVPDPDPEAFACGEGDPR